MHLPGPLRAAVGLVVTAADEAKTLPDRAVELPMLAVSTALQLSLRAQQRYARLAARGEAVLNRQEPGEDAPAWATFDDPLSAEELHRSALAQLDELVDEFGRASASGDTADDIDAQSGERGPSLADIFGEAEPGPAFDGTPNEADTDAGIDTDTDTGSDSDTATVTPISEARGSARKSPRKTSRKTAAKKAPAAKKTPAAKQAPAKKAPAAKEAPAAEKAPAKKASAAKSPAKKAPAAKKAPTKKAPAKKTSAAAEAPADKAAPAKAADTDAEAPANADAGKQVNAPRHTTPSKFDDAPDGD